MLMKENDLYESIEKSEQAIKYWIDYLSGELKSPNFFPDSPHPNEYKKGEYDILLSNEIVNKLNYISNNNDLSLFVIILTSYKILLSKLINIEDVIVASPTKGQNKYNNVILIRSIIKNDDAFKTLLFNVRQSIIDGYKNQFYSIYDIINQIDADKGVFFFKHLILMENIHNTDCVSDILANGVNDFIVSIIKDDVNISLKIQYNRNLYYKETVERIFECFIEIINQVLSDINIKIKDIELIDESRKNKILHKLNNTTFEISKDLSLNDFFNRQVEKNSDKVAVCFPIDMSNIYEKYLTKKSSFNGQDEHESSYQDKIIYEKLSYREINEKADQLAALLRKKGIGPNKIVGLLLERSPYIPIAILAAIKAGCGFLPIDTEYPVERIRFILCDSNLSVLITQYPLMEKIDFSNPIINIEDESIYCIDEKYHSTFVNQEDVVYIIYTSGTSGKPKGVVINYVSLINYINWFIKETNLSENDKTLLTSSYAFDLGYSSLFPSLFSGAELHILPKEIYLSNFKLINYIDDCKITYLKITPSFINTIVNNDNFLKSGCKSLRLILLGGEKINIEDVQKIQAINKNIRVINHYGPTEATIGCIIHPINFNEFKDYKKNPTIGKPISNCKAYIFNCGEKLLPVGIPGELYIAGSGLARGYLNMPELTHEKFIKNPYQAHEVIYKTGDLARWFHNENIEFLGRVDNQIKIRGYRVELTEIQHKLQEHPKIKESAVINRIAKEGDHYLCAYYICHNQGEELKSKNLTNKCSESKIIESENFLKTFEENVITCSNKIAVKSKVNTSYKNLNNSANLLARLIVENYDDRYKLSLKEKIRYKRQMLLSEWGLSAQERLKKASVFVAGAGGGASPTIVQLALAGVGKIIICDFDTVELSNLNRQFLHNEERIGINKALSAKATINQINPHVTVIPITEKLSENNVNDFIGDAEIIFDMFDGQEEKFILSKYATKKGIPHVISAMTDICSYTIIFHYPHTPCFHCIFDHKKLSALINGMKTVKKNYNKNPLAVVSSSLFLSTGFAVTEALKILLGFENPAYKKFFFFNQRGTKNIVESDSYKSMTYTFTEYFRETCKNQGFDWDTGWRGNFVEELLIEKDPQCPVCSYTHEDNELTKKNIITNKTKKINNEIEAFQSNSEIQTIALLLEKNNLPIGLVGAIKSRKTAVVLNPKDNEKSLMTVLEQSESRLIIVDNTNYELANLIKNKVNKNLLIINVEKLDGNETDNLSIITKPDQILARIFFEEKVLDITNNSLNQRHPDNNSIAFNQSYGNIEILKILFTLLHRDTYVAETEHSIEFSEDLRRFMSQSLPEYMIPSFFIQIDKLPLTPNGKLDIKLLPDPNSVKKKTRVLSPSNDIEARLVKIWAEILTLKEDEISTGDNFFDIGGHSLKVTAMIAKIHKEFNAEISLNQIFNFPKINEIAKFLNQNIKTFIPIKKAYKKEYYELSSAQQRLFFIQEMDKSSVAYNIPFSLLIEGNLDIKRLNDLFNYIINRHESLRTYFKIIDGKPVQIIKENIDFSIDYYDSKDLDKDRLIKSFLRPFDLAKAPLLRVNLIKIESKKYVLAIDMHHIISDGVSMNIIRNEFISYYQGEKIDEIKIQYKDYSEWQNRSISPGQLKLQKNYWIDQYRGVIPTLKLPIDVIENKEFNLEDGEISFTLDEGITAKLKKIASEEGVTLFMLFLAIYNVLLSKLSKQNDIIIGTPVAGRRHENLHNVIGMFVNTLAIRSHPQGEKSFKEFLLETKKIVIEAFDNQDYQFEDLINQLDMERNNNQYSLFNVLFTFQNIFDEYISNSEIRLSDIIIKPYHFGNSKAKFDLSLAVSETDNKIHCNLQFKTQLFLQTTIQLTQKRFEILINSIISNRDEKIEKLQYQTPEELKIKTIEKVDFGF